MLKSVKIDDLEIPGLKILSKIGEGGMSQVYLAEQISLKRKVAVKVMRLEIASSELDVQRFKHEAKTIAQLDHPNIISIYSIGQTPKGEVYFTMPYLNHGDFSNYIIENELEFIHLLQSICDGLSFAHDRGVVHRDIKPENLLFDEFGNVRIADFGIAISKNGARMTKEHQIVGSAQYMSPEQARSLKVDIQSDIYSLGIVIYERLTGKVPFDSDESISILVDHVSAKPPRLSSKMRHWQKLIDKCLEKDPNDRFQSMVELKIALNKVPTNSIQRTNNSISHVLDSTHGKHLKWFIPSLLILFILAIAFFNSKVTEDTSIPAIKDSAIVSHSPIIQNNTSNIPNNKNNLKAKQATIKTTPKQVDSKQNITNVSDKQYSIDEIKQIIALQNPSPVEAPLKLTQEQQNIKDLLDKANSNIEEYQLTKPQDNNASDLLLQVLSVSPGNPEAIIGIELIGHKYYQLIDKAINDKDYISAINHTKSVIKFNSETNNLNSQFSVQKEALLQSIEAHDYLNAGVSKETLRAVMKIVELISPENKLIGQYQQYQEKIKQKEGPQIGEKLLDEMGIETILISKKIAVTTHETTIESYAKFVKSTNRVSSKCKHQAGGFNSFFSTISWNKPLFPQAPNHPVVCISQDDAQAYGEWLSQQTENSYRLPTKKEWMLLAAADNDTFNACQSANVAGTEAKKIRNKHKSFSCNDNYQYTSPVSSFSVNGMGLYDIQGNASEWIHCDKTPCPAPIAMGSSWYDGQKSNILHMSKKYKMSSGYTDVGFRLIRDL